MKKMIFAVFAALLIVGCGNPTENRKEAITDTFPKEVREKDRIDTIFAMADAFAIQESRCNPLAVSPDSTYVGYLQISPILVDEVNRITGLSYTYDDRYDKEKSCEMFSHMMRRYNPTCAIDKAIDIWNKHAPAVYRRNVSMYYDSIMHERYGNY